MLKVLTVKHQCQCCELETVLCSYTNRRQTASHTKCASYSLLALPHPSLPHQSHPILQAQIFVYHPVVGCSWAPCTCAAQKRVEFFCAWSAQKCLKNKYIWIWNMKKVFTLCDSRCTGRVGSCQCTWQTDYNIPWLSNYSGNTKPLFQNQSKSR